MKKIASLLIAVITLLSYASAGNPPRHNRSGILEKGKIVFDVYYGFPSFRTFVLKNRYLPGNEINSASGTLGPLGGKVEYMLGDRIGIGLDINYVFSWVSWTEEESVYNPYGYWTDGDYKVANPRIGIMPRFYYHYINNDMFEMYASAAIGYKSNAFRNTSNDPYWEPTDIQRIPIGGRICIGGRLFFTDNIGMNFEFGIGGALFTVGLAGKL
ncbi:MAG: hypothetical protein V1904_11170 [Bacteroidota bacterium]